MVANTRTAANAAASAAAAAASGAAVTDTVMPGATASGDVAAAGTGTFTQGKSKPSCRLSSNVAPRRDDKRTRMAGVERHRPAARVALFPLPFQGHISPMLQLAGALHARGLAITVLHTTFNAPDPARHPGFTFVAVPDAISDVVASTKDGIAKIVALNAVVEAPALAECARDALTSLLNKSEEGEPRLACLVLDCTLTGMQKVAIGLEIPTLVLQTCSAACFRLIRSYDMLYEKGYLPAQESNLLLPVKELPPLQVRDLFDPSILLNKEIGMKLLNLASETAANSCGAIMNTFQALESQELATVRGELLVDKGVPTFAIGPLHKFALIDGFGTTSSLLNQDRSCIEWLDTQDPGSVLYVSFGSMVRITKHEFTEVAWGLADSGKPFLWVVRQDFVLGAEKAELPLGFECAVEGRGKVIEWAPQQEVLAHSAVGGFWTHNGWNSTLESIYEGVPMLSSPYIGDQLATGRYVQDAWKIGILLESLDERGKIKKAITTLMEAKEGLEIRERAKSFKEKARLCLEIGGSSHQDLDRLVDHILSL